MKDWRVSDKIAVMKKSAIHEMTRLSKDLEDVAFLSWAKPMTTTPEHINRAAIKAIEDGLVGGYSTDQGLIELREEIVRKLARDNNISADASEIIVTTGAIEGLAATCIAILNPGDEVIMPSPTYSTHASLVKLASAVPIFVPSHEEEGFALDVDAMERAITNKTKAFMFCTPSNPTGAVYSEKDLRRLAEVAIDHNLMIITDEAYEYFIYDGAKHFSIGSIPEARKNVISCFTFTKTYAMTGWRLGYLHAEAELIPQIMKAHIPLTICSPVVSQYAAIGALRGSQDCVEDFRKHYLKARDLMCERLDALNSVFDYSRPPGSYLMFPRILEPKGAVDSTNFCLMLLRELRISTTPGVAFGPTGEGHLRLSFCVSDDMINKAFDRMDKYFGAA